MSKIKFIATSLATALVACIAYALPYDDKPVEIKFKARSPDQMASFYEARGFPDKMLKVIRQQCFITAVIRNTGKDVVWLEMKNWHFSANGKRIVRLTRDEWKKYWSGMGIPLSKQSTFHWTQIPDVLDYLPNEKEGGNIILPRTDQVITIKASFVTGIDKNGPVLNLIFSDIRCAEDQP